jgi:uncharacterized membrane protein
MKPTADGVTHRDRIIAGLLWYGTWLASALIAAGMTLHALQRFTGPLALGLSRHAFVTAGVAVFILLPVARVALMLIIFLRERDYAYSAISAFVLAIIAAGITFGL